MKTRRRADAFPPSLSLCNSFFLVAPDLPNTITQSLPSSLSIETPTQELSSVFAKLLVDFMPKEGSYNLIFTARQFFVVPRSDGRGDLGKGEGKVDGGRLLGVL